MMTSVSLRWLLLTSLILPAIEALKTSRNTPKHGANVVPEWSGYRSVGYFTNWGIYDPQNYFVTNITAKDFTHINYAFANVDPDNGTVFLDDPEADLEYEYRGDNFDEPGHNLYGNLKQLFLLKEHNRNLKVLLSIGGASYSPNYENIVDPAWRETFANTSVTLLSNIGFDGLDIDYEYIRGPQAQAMIELFKLIREKLNDAQLRDKADHYLLTWAAGCGEFGWSDTDVAGMDPYLDFWNLMAYDFSGEWTELALPASNLWPDTNPINDVGASGSQCVEHYMSEGVHPRKLNLGMALYGTAFNGSTGMWTNYTDVGDGDYDQPGNYDVKHLPLEGAVMFYNESLGSSWSYDNSTGHVISFDTPTVAFQKAEYVLSNHLGGMMYWSIDQDSPKHQSEGRPHGPHKPGRWDREQGGGRKANYGHWKGAKWPLTQEWKASFKSLSGRALPASSATHHHERGAGIIHADKRWGSASGMGWFAWWGELDDLRHWKPKMHDGICTNIGYSLVDTVVTAFEKYGGGLDRSKNNLHYRNSEYDNIRQN